MIKFFDGSHLGQKICAELSRAKKIRVAVAYWGKDAIKNLGLEKLRRRDVKIICDLESGASNPCEVKQLQKIFGRENILSCPRLHAKVWLTDRCAIIGSSNASTNGLAFEREELKGLIEANVITDDKDILGEINSWIDETVMTKSKKIEPEDIRKAEKLWKSRRENRPLYAATRGGSLLKFIRNNPDAFADRNVQVWIWKQRDRRQSAEKEIKMAQLRQKNKNIDGYELDKNEKSPAPGMLIIEFDKRRGPQSKKKSQFEFIEITKILKDHPIRPFKGGKVALCLPSEKLVLGLRIPKEDRKEWEAAADKAAKKKSKWFGSLDDFAKFLTCQPAHKRANGGAS